MTAAEVERVVASRRMVTVRAIIEGQARVLAALVPEYRKSGLPMQDIYDGLALIEEALAEVDAAERGCGATEPGECMCPCHLLP